VGLWELNIDLLRMSGGLMGVQYWTVEGVQWVHQSSILNYHGCLVGSLELNIELLLRMSGGFKGVQYSTMQGVRWTHGGSILNCIWCPVGSWEVNIQLWRESGGLIQV
jgi:hypothetical protein